MAERPPKHQAFLQEVAPITEVYFPNDNVHRNAGNLAVTTVSGPRGIGKTTLMQKSGLAIARAGTSRARRTPDEDTYHPFLDFMRSEDRDYILDGLGTGSFLQIISHPANQELYFTDLDSFPESDEGVYLLDVTATEYDRLKKLRLFKDIRPTFVITPTYEQWQDQLSDHHLSPAEYQKTMNEARDSLGIAVRHPDMHFVINKHVEQAALDLRAIACGETREAAETINLRGRALAQSFIIGIDRHR